MGHGVLWLPFPILLVRFAPLLRGFWFSFSDIFITGASWIMYGVVVGLSCLVTAEFNADSFAFNIMFLVGISYFTVECIRLLCFLGGT